MKYYPKTHGCPYRTADGKCTHRYRRQKITRRKRFCGYSKPEHCEMYIEWIELRKEEENASIGFISTIESEGVK